MSEREEKIRALAYELWEAAGQPHGDDQRFWHEAEARIAASEAKDDPAPTLVVTPKRPRKVAKAEPVAAPSLAAASPSPVAAKSKAAPKATKPSKAKAKSAERSPLH